MVDRADVVWAYRHFLCRDPDEQYVEEIRQRNAGSPQLRDQFVTSAEFGVYLSSLGFVRSQIVRCFDRANRPFYITDAFLPFLADLVTGSYQNRASAWVQQNIKDGNIFIDVGAGIGWFTLLAGECVGRTGKVYAFEPHATTFEALLTSR